MNRYHVSGQPQPKPEEKYYGRVGGGGVPRDPLKAEKIHTRIEKNTNLGAPISLSFATRGSTFGSFFLNNRARGPLLFVFFISNGRYKGTRRRRRSGVSRAKMSCCHDVTMSRRKCGTPTTTSSPRRRRRQQRLSMDVSSSSKTPHVRVLKNRQRGCSCELVLS